MELGEKVYLSKSSVSPYTTTQFVVSTGVGSLWEYVYKIMFLRVQDMVNGIENRKF